MTLSRPRVSGPDRWACEPIVQPGPTATGPSITANGPTRTPAASAASADTSAVGWIGGGAGRDIGILSGAAGRAARVYLFTPFPAAVPEQFDGGPPVTPA